jgi:hypothetical protein
MARRKVEGCAVELPLPLFCYQDNHGNVDWDGLISVVLEDLLIGYHGKVRGSERLKRGASSEWWRRVHGVNSAHARDQSIKWC